MILINKKGKKEESENYYYEKKGTNIVIYSVLSLNSNYIFGHIILKIF
jgi:hypothetical protein